MFRQLTEHFSTLNDGTTHPACMAAEMLWTPDAYDAETFAPDGHDIHSSRLDTWDSSSKDLSHSSCSTGNQSDLSRFSAFFSSSITTVGVLEHAIAEVNKSGPSIDITIRHPPFHVRPSLLPTSSSCVIAQMTRTLGRHRHRKYHHSSSLRIHP
jgi:hypothetical protein